MVTENPRIAVCYACTYKPALITGILQFPSISTQEFNFPVYSTDVVLTAMQVKSKKMRTKTVA